MADRTVSVSLVLRAQNYMAGMQAAGRETQAAASKMKSATAALEAQNRAMKSVGTGFLAVGAVAAAGLALVVKAAAEFGAKMAQLQALSHASAGQMKELSDAAMTAGQAYGFSATQVADAEIELTKAGIGVKQQLGGALKGALSLAAAGQIDVGQATEIATVAMTQFGLKAGQIPHLADLLSAGADKALGSVGDLGDALKNGGLQAKNMGLTINDTVGVLSAFANKGIIGAEAGTQLRSMFIQLQRPSTAAKKTMDEYGISIYDASGKFVGITKLAGELQDKLGGLTQAQRNTALATIFGSHAIVGATALYGYGAKGIAGWIKSVNDSGFASQQASGKLNSLQGDVQKLSAAFQTDLIKAGSGADNALRPIVQVATDLLKAFGDLDPSARNLVVKAALVTAGVGLVGGAFLVAVPKVAEFSLALKTLGFNSGTAVASLAKVGAQAGVTAGEVQAAALKTESAAAASARSAVGLGAPLALGATGAAKGGGLLAGLGKGVSGFATTAEEGAGSVLKVGAGAAGAVAFLGQGGVAAPGDANYRDPDGLAKYNGKAGSGGRSQTSVPYKSNAAAINTDKKAVQALSGAQSSAASSAGRQAVAISRITGAGAGAAISMTKLQKALSGLGSNELDARSAARAFQQAIDDASASVKQNGKTAIDHGNKLDIDTQKGRDNAQALDTVASSAIASAAAYVKNGGSAEGAASKVADGRAAFVKSAEAMGLSKSAADRLANSLGLIPKNVYTTVKVSGADAAAAQIASIKRSMTNLDGTSASVYINAVQNGLGTSRAALLAKTARLNKAEGGSITGSGPKGVDSVPAVLAPGEHVLTAKDVDKMGGQSSVYAFRAALHYAAGGTAGETAAERRAATQEAAARRRAASARTSAAKALATLQVGFLADVRAGDYNSASKYVSELDRMAKDTVNFSASTRKRFADMAGSADKAFKKLQDSASKTADTLKDLKDSAAQEKSSIAGSITGGFGLANAANTTTASSWAYQDGIRYRTTSTGYTAKSLTSYEKSSAASAKAFAAKLKTLASRGVAAGILAEIAGEGVDGGTPMAAALLSASKSQIKSIDSNYAAVSKYANAAGSTVATSMYGKQIKAAQNSVDKVKKAIEDESKKLRHVIGKGLHVKGYAAGTMNASAGLHWVGESGPELAYVPGGTRVWSHGTGPSASLPEYITLVDESGGILTKARVQTTKQITAHDTAKKYSR